MTTTKKFTFDCAQYVVDRLDMDGHEAKVREDYSGRGMYGATCVAIVTEADSAARIGELVAAYNEEYETDIPVPSRSDSMGLDTIYY